VTALYSWFRVLQLWREQQLECGESCDDNYMLLVVATSFTGFIYTVGFWTVLTVTFRSHAIAFKDDVDAPKAHKIKWQVREVVVNLFFQMLVIAWTFAWHQYFTAQLRHEGIIPKILYVLAVQAAGVGIVWTFHEASVLAYHVWLPSTTLKCMCVGLPQGLDHDKNFETCKRAAIQSCNQDIVGQMGFGAGLAYTYAIEAIIAVALERRHGPSWKEHTSIIIFANWISALLALAFMLMMLMLKFRPLYRNFEMVQEGTYRTERKVGESKEARAGRKRMNLVDAALGLTPLSRYADEVIIFVSNFSFFDAIYQTITLCHSCKAIDKSITFLVIGMGMTLGGSYLFAFSQLRISKLIVDAQNDGEVEAVEIKLIKFASHTAKVLAVGLSYTIGRMWYMCFNQGMSHSFNDSVNTNLTNMVAVAVSFSLFSLFLVLFAKYHIHHKLIDQSPDKVIHHLIEQEEKHTQQQTMEADQTLVVKRTASSIAGKAIV
jgi:hypothetical protein